MDKKEKLVLLPGLGANHLLFSGLSFSDFELICPQFKAPKTGESLKEYAKRWAAEFKGPLWLGGFSFGGSLALEMAEHLECRGVFLVTSFSDSSQLPSRFHQQVRMGLAFGDSFIRATMRGVLKPLFSRLENLNPQHVSSLHEMLESLDMDFFRWSAKAMSEWQASATQWKTPYYHIHGKADSIIPMIGQPVDFLIENGKHLICWSHPQELAQFMESVQRGDYLCRKSG